jgi:hypothetical protein
VARSLFIGIAVWALALTAVQAQEASCTNAGNVYQIGDVACIAACHGQRQLARCDRVADATKWTQLPDACPSAMRLDATRVARWSAIPAPMTPIPSERPSIL